MLVFPKKKAPEEREPNRTKEIKKTLSHQQEKTKQWSKKGGGNDHEKSCINQRSSARGKGETSVREEKEGRDEPPLQKKKGNNSS